MTEAEFKPGFRISIIDTAVLVGGLIGSMIAWQTTWWLGFAIAYVVAHFFLFCNVLRIARIPELIWAAVFIGLAGSTIVSGSPGWIGTIVASLALTITLIAIEIQKPSYHGIGWQRWNPNLPQRWQSHFDRPPQAVRWASARWNI